MKKWLVGFVVLMIVNQAGSSESPYIKGELIGILELQKESWNRQDLEGFMAYYWNSDEFTFQSGANRLRGWKALLERYKKSYSGENWGELDFTDLEVNVLSDDFAYVLGRWKLKIKDSLREGVFTIIFKRLPEGWRIIHDHSS
ncbi:MAG: nuclear transport factor 2 family protein [Clostridiales bacterium]|jgi:beta-aspartyl-peptidase (threonine type)|nr:nuclear transport factor 2 family protein [Clostridiales bacterium]